MKNWRLTVLAVALSALAPAWAQQSDSMPMNHEGMNHDHMGMSHDMDAEANSTPPAEAEPVPPETSQKPKKPRQRTTPATDHDAGHSMHPGMNHDGMSHSMNTEANPDTHQGMDHGAMSAIGVDSDEAIPRDTAGPGMNHDGAAMNHDGISHSMNPGENSPVSRGMDHGTMHVMEVNSGAPAPAETGADATQGGAAMNHNDMAHTTNAEADPGMSHGMNHGAMPVMKVVGGEQVTPEAVGAGMAHDSADMQGGSAPSDARDPHAYSGGYDFGPIPRPHLADEHYFGSLLIDQLEYTESSDENAVAYDVQGWFGRDYDRAVLKAEGEIDDGELQESRTELLWGHAIAAYWDTQLGVRHDSNGGPDRNWLAFGIQGLAPYWFEVDAAAYVGDEGRSALRLDAEYELLFTQRLILQPHVEANFYGKRDPERALGSGLSDAVAGLRLRYEIKRQFGPYFGVEWQGLYGETADFAEAVDSPTDETRWVAGFRAWF